MKKIAFISGVLILFSLSLYILKSTEGETDYINDGQPMCKVCDINGSQIDGMQMSRAIVTLLDDGYVYCTTKTYSHNTDYYRYYFSSNKSVKIGTVQCRGQTHDPVLLDQHMYFLVAAVNAYSYDKINLIDIDLSKNKLWAKSLLKIISDNKLQYSFSMEVDTSDASGQRLLILIHQSEDTQLLQYDPKTKKTTQSLLSGMLKNLQNAGSTTEFFGISGNTISFLEQSAEGEVKILNCPFAPQGKDENAVLNDIEYLDATEISDDIKDKTDYKYRDGYQKSNPIIDFITIGNYVLCNYNTLSLDQIRNLIETPKSYFGLQNNGKLESAMSISGNILKANNAKLGADSTLVFFDNTPNNIYYFDANEKSSSKMKKAAINLQGLVMQNVYRSPDDHLLVAAWKRGSGNYTDMSYYYIKLSDLKFQSVNIQEK